MAEAQRQCEKLSSSANRTFQSLVHYGLGKVLLKEHKWVHGAFSSICRVRQGNLVSRLNSAFIRICLLFRFSKAKEEFLKALLMVQRQIMPGKLTWPTTKVTVEETCPEYLKVSLCTRSNIWWCLFWVFGVIICSLIRQGSYCIFLLLCSLKEQLERLIETCKFPPKPDAVCRHCLGQAVIYFTDPDFKVSDNAQWLLFRVHAALQHNYSFVGWNGT